jgi:hypothetical protein
VLATRAFSAAPGLVGWAARATRLGARL